MWFGQMVKNLQKGPGVRGKSPILVGLTGGVGSGKSVIAAEFEKRGATVISGDEIGHYVVDRNHSLQEALARVFGEDIFEDNKINRQMLARRAFASSEGRAQLNQLVHPVLIKELNRQIAVALKSSGVPLIVVDAALLVEWGKQVPVDIMVAVRASRARRFKWLRKRGWSKSEIRDRMKAQLPFSARAALADYVVRNDGDLAALQRKAVRLWQKLLDHR